MNYSIDKRVPVITGPFCVVGVDPDPIGADPPDCSRDALNREHKKDYKIIVVFKFLWELTPILSGPTLPTVVGML